MKAYGALAPYYDRFMSFLDYDAEAAALGSFLRATGCGDREILDLGAGSGGHLLPLAAAGFAMTGLDLCEEMVAIIRKKLARAGLEAAAVVGDIRCPDLPKDHYAAAYCWGDTVHHLTAMADFTAFLSAVYALLRPGGYLLFNWREEGYFDELMEAGDFYEYHGEDVLLWRSSLSGNDHCRLTLQAFIKEEDNYYRRVEETHTLRIWTEDALCAAIISQGFTIIDGTATAMLAALEAPEEYRKIFIIKK